MLVERVADVLQEDQPEHEFLVGLAAAIEELLQEAPTARTDGGNAWGGASGVAIFCGGHLVGVVTEEDHTYGARRLIALPVSSFAGDGGFVSHVEEQTGRSPELSAIGASLPEAGPAAERTPVERELEKLLAPLFSYPDVRVDHARALARELGYEAEGYEPTAADLVALLMAHPRALASLGEAVASNAQGTARAALTHLFSWARALDCGSLLSVNEYDALIGLLRRVCEKQGSASRCSSSMIPCHSRANLNNDLMQVALSLETPRFRPFESRFADFRVACP
ncbi:hypothetical protein OG301_32790 [Streptomyces platensis]|uniref:hypothetical protein n=1 Tax=Streptomyces platensis TaxID=58346 RepID=UPI002ED6A581|nr:hypothetical protein OG301_32790 [Streptomyces platensis]